MKRKWIYGIAIAGLLFAASASTGCSSDGEPVSPADGNIAETALLVKKTGTRKASAPDASSTEDEILKYLLTFNGEFEARDEAAGKAGSRIRIVNNLIDGSPNFATPRVPDKIGDPGYYEYYCADADTTSDGFYRFKPTIADKRLYWGKDRTDTDPNAIQTDGSYYTFNALYYWVYGDRGESEFDRIGIDDGGIYGFVFEDQSTEQRFRACDVMQAHHMKDKESQFGEVIKLQFWHQLAMVVINVGVPKETYGIGFTAAQMQEAVCSLTDFYCGYYLSYNLDTDSDQYVTTTHIGADHGGKPADIKMWPVGGIREETDASGIRQLKRTYAALVPPIDPDQNKSFKLCRFRINGKNYSYTANNDVEIKHTQMTIIDLHINPDRSDPILLNARILPWGTAYVPDFPLYPEKNDNQ